MDDTKNKMQRLEKGIHRLPDGRFRIYYTASTGDPVRVIVDWDLLTELKVEVAEGTRQGNPGIKLARLALAESRSKVRTDKRSGAVAVSKRVKIGDLYPLVERDYKRQGRKSLDHVQSRWKEHLKAHFENIVANSLSSGDINDYIDLRYDESASGGTINRELSIIRRAMRLGQREKPPLVATIPYFEKQKESDPRQGFLTDSMYDTLAQECLVEGLWLRTALAIAANLAWRRAEVFGLKVRQVDLSAGTLSLDQGETKNDDGRLAKMPSEVLQLVAACVAGKKSQEYVLQRDGIEGRVSDFRNPWQNACDRAGCPDLLYHDLRRTGARNMRRLGIGETVIMKVGGWKTAEIFRRYDIVDQTDLEDVARRLDEKRAARLAGDTDKKTDNSQHAREQRLQ
jgi:integrase